VPKIVVQHPFWVKNRNKTMLTVSAKSQAHAKAGCETDNTSAFAEGRGSAKATAWLRARNVLKGKKLKEVITKQKLKAQGRAQSKASADAKAVCAEASQTSTTATPPPETPPKNGEPGAGSGTTDNTSTGSTTGGSGTPGQTGNANETHACYDPADSTNGDGNPDTTGSTMYSSTTNDQFGYCTSPAQPAVNG